MKKRIFLVVAAMLVFGLAIVAFSYGTTNNATSTVATCCCCSGDSCPMKQKDASGKEIAATHENCDCCGGGAESCPMMKGDASRKMEGMKHEMKADGTGHSCGCCSHNKEKKDAPAI